MIRCRRVAVVCAAALVAACFTRYNGIDACDGGPPGDTRVNERGDQYEFASHPYAAAALSNGRVLVAFSAQTIDDAGTVVTSEVRIALLQLGTGDRLTVCNTGALDRTISEPGTYGWRASVAPVDLTIAGQKALALVAWTEGAALPDAYVRMRFVDGAGCPLALPFRSYAAPATLGSIAWSEQRHAVLATAHDERSVYRTWVDAASPGEPLVLATGAAMIYGYPLAAVAPSGAAIVTWAEHGVGPRAILLDADGNPRSAAPADGQAAPFPLEFPANAQEPFLSLLAVTAREDRFAVAVQQQPTAASAVSRAMARELSLDAAPLGPAFFLDGGDAAAQGLPAIAYAPGATLVAVWEARAAGGTVGRLFGDGGAPRFNAIACDDERFVIGTRAQNIIGWPSLLVSGGQVFVVHNGEGAADPRGTATLAWQVPFAELWPGPQ